MRHCHNLGIMLRKGAERVTREVLRRSKIYSRAIGYGNVNPMSKCSRAALTRSDTDGLEPSVIEGKQLMSRVAEG